MQNEIAKIESRFPNNAALLGLYKIEKDQMDLPSDPFMPFKEWKEQYKAEWMESHVDSRLVDAETGVAEADKEIDDVEKEEKKKETPKVERKGFQRIDFGSKVKKVKQPKVEKPKVEKEKKVSKSDLAMEIYKSMMVNGEHPARKDVIDRFMKEVGLTAAGSSTYQHNCKKKLGG